MFLEFDINLVGHESGIIILVEAAVNTANYFVKIQFLAGEQRPKRYGNRSSLLLCDQNVVII